MKTLVHYLTHELLGGEDEFVVDEPARPVLKQTAVRVGVHRLLVLHRLVRPARLREARRVVEEPGRHRLKHGGEERETRGETRGENSAVTA